MPRKSHCDLMGTEALSSNASWAELQEYLRPGILDCFQSGQRAGRSVNSAELPGGASLSQLAGCQQDLLSY